MIWFFLAGFFAGFAGALLLGKIVMEKGNRHD